VDLEDFLSQQRQKPIKVYSIALDPQVVLPPLRQTRQRGASLRFAVATAEGFWHPEQADLTGDYVERYFTEMPAMAARRTPGAANRLAGAAYPHYAVSERTLAAAEAMLARDDLNPALRRVAVDATDDLRRALAARALLWT
jgi:aminopeptidase N